MRTIGIGIAHAMSTARGKAMSAFATIQAELNFWPSWSRQEAKHHHLRFVRKSLDKVAYPLYDSCSPIEVHLVYGIDWSVVEGVSKQRRICDHDTGISLLPE
jgi:hypothetical protein